MNIICSCGLAGNIRINSLSVILKSIPISVLGGGGKEFSFKEVSILVSCSNVSSYAEICPVRCDAVDRLSNLRPFLSQLMPPF